MHPDRNEVAVEEDDNSDVSPLAFAWWPRRPWSLPSALDRWRNDLWSLVTFFLHPAALVLLSSSSMSDFLDSVFDLWILRCACAFVVALKL